MGRTAIDLTGQRFSRLVVIERAAQRNGQSYWRCQCDCGSECLASGQMLRRGMHKSCGCLKREMVTTRNTKHGMSHTPTYWSWSNMMRRCTKPDEPRYPDWGGRGITVCDRWHDFAAFLEDMGEKPDGTMLERRDNDGPYDPGNCYWASPFVQSRNKRSTRLTREVILRIRDLAAAGTGVQEIATEVGLERHSVGVVMATIDALG